MDTLLLIIEILAFTGAAACLFMLLAGMGRGSETL
jgi:hypothetical protein